MDQALEKLALLKCQNTEQSLGASCVRCNKCGRFNLEYRVKVKCPFCKTDFEADKNNSNYDSFRNSNFTLKQKLVNFKCPVCKNMFFKILNEIKEEGAVEDGRTENVCENDN